MRLLSLAAVATLFAVIAIRRVTTRNIYRGLGDEVLSSNAT
jgi:hypothetical protein